MKNATFNIPRFQTMSLRTCMAIVGLSLSPAIGWAQESPATAKDATSSASPAVRDGATDAPPIPAAKMPDISGTWQISEGVVGEIGRDEEDPASLVIGTPDEKGTVLYRAKWSAEQQHFILRRFDPRAPKYYPIQLTAKLLPDGKTLQFKASLDEQARQELLKAKQIGETEFIDVTNESWTWTRLKSLAESRKLTSETVLVREAPVGNARIKPTFVMPYISGTWIVTPDSPLGTVDIYRIRHLPTGYINVYPHNTDGVNGQRASWSEETQRFEATIEDPDDGPDALSFQPSVDGHSMQVITEFSEQAKQTMSKKGVSPQALAARSQVWKRSPLPSSTGVLTGDVPDPSTTQSEVKPAAVDKVPDIVGTWSVVIWYHENGGEFTPVEAGEMEIRRLGAENFQVDQPGVEKTTRIFVQWSAPNRRFQGVWSNDEDGSHSKMTLQPATDINTLRVIVTKTPSSKETVKDGAEQSPAKKQLPQQWPQEWRRTSLTLSTNLGEKVSDQPETKSGKSDVIQSVREPTGRLAIVHRHNKSLVTREPISRIAVGGTDIIDFIQYSEKELGVIGKGVGSTTLTLWFEPESEPATILVNVTPQGSGVALETPLSKQLAEQLQAQESAAAAEAATIQQLRQNGQAERDQTAIAEHQRKLTVLLGTAFDLKLQLEELQVKELQSRLSRLERQIGQRQGLREKIIARRASDLIDGDHLKWTSIATPKSREQVVTVPDGGTAAVQAPSVSRTSEVKPAVPSAHAIKQGGKDEKITVDLYGGAKVLPRISQTPKHGRLLQTLNAMTGVVTNFRELKVDDETMIVTAIVRDPSLRCLQEMQRTGKESELKTAINAALKEAGVAIRWEEGSTETEVTEKAAPEEQRPTTATPHKSSKINSGESVDELLSGLLKERDMLKAISILQRLGTQDLSAHGERAAMIILESMEFHDPINSEPRTNVPPSYFATEVLKKIARPAKMPAYVKALNEGHPRVKYVALWSLGQDASLWEYANEPGFPKLAEMLLEIASQPDESQRVGALDILAKTLPITRIDLSELTTVDRREAVRKLAQAIPQERVYQLVSDALDAPQIMVVLSASRLLLEMPEKKQDPAVASRIVTVCAQITKGEFHGLKTLPSQRGQALGLLIKLRDKSAPAVPMLIELLKSEKTEFTDKGDDPQGRMEDFSRGRVIMALGAIGPAAKDALPILEAELAVLDNKAREDALLSGQPESKPPRAFGGSPASRLRLAIAMIKGDRQPFDIFRGDGGGRNRN